MFYFLLGNKKFLTDLILLLAGLDGGAVSLDLGLLAGDANGGEGRGGSHIGGDGLHDDLRSGLRQRKDGSNVLGRGLAVIGGGVSGLGGREAPAGEDNELGGVLLEALDVDVEALRGAVGPAVVDSDAHGAGVGGGEAGGLDLLEGEAAAEAGLGRVLLGLAVDDGAEHLEGTGGDAGGPGGTSHATGLLLGSLVEVQLSLQGTTGRSGVLLLEVDIGDDIIMLNHLRLSNMNLTTEERDAYKRGG